MCLVKERKTLIYYKESLTNMPNVPYLMVGGIERQDRPCELTCRDPKQKMGILLDCRVRSQHSKMTEHVGV
jgi:hypothetical protein